MSLREKKAKVVASDDNTARGPVKPRLDGDHLTFQEREPTEAVLAGSGDVGAWPARTPAVKLARNFVGTNVSLPVCRA
jgi:hypothetical protein